MDTKHMPGPPCVLRNPLNGLIWSRHNSRPVTELSGDYTVYLSAAHAELALRRNRVLWNAGFVIEPEPAHTKSVDWLSKQRAFASAYGRLAGDCKDAAWNAFEAGWDWHEAIAKATRAAQ